MKNLKLFSIITICLLFTLQSKSIPITDSLKSLIPDTSQITLNKVYNDVKEGLIGLGSALKVGSEHVYEVLVKQQLVNSINGLLLIILTIILSILVIKGYIKIRLKYKDDYDNSDVLIWYCIFLGGGALVMFGSSIYYIPDIITGFVNPEYGAMKDIMTFIK